MTHKLLWKLLASFVAVLLLFTLIMSGIFLTLFKQHTVSLHREDMIKKAVSIADTLSGFPPDGMGGMGHGGGGMGMGGYGAYLRFLDELAMADVWLVDQNMTLLTYGHGQSKSTACDTLPPGAEDIVQRVFAGEVTYGEDFSALLTTPSLSVGAPIRQPDGRISGAVLLHAPISGIDAAVRQGGTAMAVGSGIALIFAAIAAFWLAYTLSNPLKQMTSAALCLAEGDYTAHNEVVQQDEIGELAAVLNLLSGRLATAEQERAALDQLREGFVTDVSHELRTPVAVLRGSLEVLKDGTVHEPTEVAAYYEQMLSESQHLERLINDLLELSRLQDVGFILEVDEVNLCDVVRDVSRAMRRLAQEKAVQITTACPADECLIIGDYGRIRQMLVILMDNAIKFSATGGLVTLCLSQEDEAITLTVTDHGTGIPADDLPIIFERFKKTHSQQNVSGTGLGLAIAKQIADRHHAELTAQSGTGCTIFTARFPR